MSRSASFVSSPKPTSCSARTRGGRARSSRHGISAKLLSYHEHNEAKRTAELLPRLVAGERMALVSDAAHRISDPGNRLVAAAIETGVPVTVLPGASAGDGPVASGLRERYQFVGYLREGRRRWRRCGTSWGPGRTQSSRSSSATPAEDARVARRRVAGAAGRRVQGADEGVRRGRPGRACRRPRSVREPPKGRSPPSSRRRLQRPDAQADEAAAAVAELVAAGLTRRDAAELVSRLTSIPRGRLYRRSLTS